ncbi:MAG: hypothetical protein OQK04_14940, partial [Kangiellaceae bacterium]|nr:hypothetical protein [Kangiellaceae bacterium]
MKLVSMSTGKNVKLLLTFLFFSMVGGLPASAKSDGTQRIKELTEVCSLTEELLQEYILLGLGIDAENALAAIEKNIKAVDNKLEHLHAQFSRNTDNNAITQIGLHWNAVKPMLKEEPDYVKATRLKVMVDKLIRECLALDFKVAKADYNQASTNYVKLSELGILSRQMASVYLLTAWRKEPPSDSKHFHEISKEFLQELDDLLSSPAQDVPKSVKDILYKVKSELRVFRIFATSN